MRPQLTMFTPTALLLVATTSLGACGGPGDPNAGLPPTSLSAEEQAAVIFMREEEKLARDVYAALTFQDPSFTNIRDSEQRHFDSVGDLVTRYQLTDPAAGKAAGEFTDPRLQALHDQLVTRGATSRLEALLVGAEIEELDLRDLQVALDAVTHDDVAVTYDNLMRGSRNHLRTYYGKVVAAGGSYAPQYLTAAELEAIVTSPKERGP